MRRSVALLLGFVVLVSPTACTSDSGSTSARDDKTGTMVTVDKDKLGGGSLQLTTVNTPSVDTGGYTTFPGEATKVEVTGGSLKSNANAEVTISYPENATEEQVNNLTILRFEGNEWTALQPEAIDKQKHTATVRTNQFSIWDIGWWDIEQATEKAKTKARNLFSSDGLLSGIGRAAGNPPVAEDCKYQALPLTIELDAFVSKTIECVKFIEDDTDRQTFTLQLSNRHTEPYLLRLPKGVSYQSVTPEPSNPFSLLVDLLGRRTNDRAVVMGGGTMVTLKVDATQLDKDEPSVISGTLDLTRPILDLMSASLQVVLPAKPTDAVVRAVANTNQAAEVGACAYKHFDQIAQSKPATTAALSEAIATAIVDCAEVMKNLGMILAEKMIEGWDRTQYATAAAKALLGSQIKATVLIWQNSHVIPQMISAVAELARNGLHAYTAKVTYGNPPFDRLNEVLPSTEGSFSNPSEPHASVQTFPTIGTQCVDKIAGNDWDNWLYSPSKFSGKWYKDGNIGSSVYVTYVKPEFRTTVKDYFVHLTGNGECDGEIKDTYGTYNKEWRSYDSSLKLKGFAVFQREFLYLPDSDGFTPYFSATLYDPKTGALIYLTTSDNVQNPLEDELPSEEALKSTLASQLDYFTNRTDVQLGTDFVANK